MTKIFAHRGYSALYPENTMLAFKQALAAGADGIELDVQLTKDGVVVICHDEDIARTSTGDGLIKEYTYEELQRYNFANGNPEVNEKIPTLADYLDWVKETDLLTNIELKTNVFEYDGLVEKVLALVEERGLTDKIIYSSFNHQTIATLMKLKPEALCGFLTDCKLLNPEEYCTKHGVGCYHPNYLSVTKETVTECHKRNILVHPYTINEEETIKQFLAWQIDIIITNEVELAVELNDADYTT